jgi:hypothetical protein
VEMHSVYILQEMLTGGHTLPYNNIAQLSKQQMSNRLIQDDYVLSNEV